MDREELFFDLFANKLSKQRIRKASVEHLISDFI